MKAKEAPKEKDASSILQSIPVHMPAATLVPVKMSQLSHSTYTIERLGDSIARIESAHSHFADTHTAAAHAHSVERWEALPMNTHRRSERHHHNGRLFEKLNSILE